MDREKAKRREHDDVCVIWELCERERPGKRTGRVLDEDADSSKGVSHCRPLSELARRRALLRSYISSGAIVGDGGQEQQARTCSCFAEREGKHSIP